MTRKYWCVYSKKTKWVVAYGQRRAMERVLKVLRQNRWCNMTIKEIRL